MELGKRIIFTALVLIFISVNVCTVSAQPVSVGFGQAVQEVEEGDTVVYEILLDTKGNSVYGAEFNLIFDKNVVEAVSIEKGSIFGASTLELKNIDNSAGNIRYSLSRSGVTSGVTSSGTLAYVTFRGVNIGFTSLSFDGVVVNDPTPLEIPSTGVGGSINVKSASTPTPTLTPTLTTTPITEPATTQTVTPTESTSSGGIDDDVFSPSGEIFENIEFEDDSENDIKKDIPVSYNISTPENPIEEIIIIGNVDEFDVSVTTEILRDTSTLVDEAPAGAVYKNINIQVGSLLFGKSGKIKDSIIKFKVDNLWLTNNNLEIDDVSLVKWDRSKWVFLETIVNRTDSDYTYYDSKTKSYSSFAIIGKNLELKNPNSTVVTLSSPYLVTEGDFFVVNVDVSSKELIFGADFKMQYDVDIIEAVKIEQGTFIDGSFIVNNIDNEKGEIVYSETNTNNLSDNKLKGSLAKATFMAKKSGKTGIQPVYIELINADDKAVDNIIYSGVNVTVIEKPEDVETSSQKGTSAGILFSIIIMLISFIILKSRN